MARKRQEYETAIIISGDDKGGIKVLEATGEQVEELSKKQRAGGERAEKYGKQHKDSGDRLSKFSSAVKGGINIVVKAAAATAAAITGLVAVNSKVIAEQARTAQMLGISTQSFQAQAHMAKLAGLDVSEYGDVLRDVTVRVREFASIGTGEAADFFEGLNLDIAEFKDLAPDELLAAIGQELEGLNRNDRLLFLDQLGSDQATRLVDVIHKLDEMEQEAIAIGVALSDVDAEQVNQAAVGLEKVQSVMTGAANQITAGFAPIVSDLTTRFYDAAVGAGGIESAVDSFIEGALTGIGFLGDRLHQIRGLLMMIKLGWLGIAAGAMDAVSTQVDGITWLINQGLKPFQVILGKVADLWATILKGLSHVPGIPFKGELRAASDALADFSEDIQGFELDATTLNRLNERTRAGLAAAREELETLVNSPPPSDRLAEWYEEVKQRAEELAEATLEANSAQGEATEVTSTQSAAIEQLIEQLEFEHSLLGMTALEQKIQNNLRKAGADITDEQREAIIRLTTELHNSEKGMAGLTAEGQIQINMVENLQREWASLIDKLITGEADVGDFFDTFVKGIKRVVAEAAAADLANLLLGTGGGGNLLGLLSGGIPGLGNGGQTAGLSNLAGVGGGLSLSGLASGAGGFLQGAFGFGQGASSFVGPMTQSATVGSNLMGSLSGFMTSPAGIAAMAAIAGKLIHDATNDPDGFHRGVFGFLSAPTSGAPSESTFAVESFASGFAPTGIADGPVSRQDAMNFIEQYRFLDQTYVDAVLAAGGGVSPVGTLGGFGLDGVGDGTLFGGSQLTTQAQLEGQQLAYLKQLVDHTVGLAPDVISQLMGAGSAQEMVDILGEAGLTGEVIKLVDSNEFVVDANGNLIDSQGEVVASMNQLTSIQAQLPGHIATALISAYNAALNGAGDSGDSTSDSSQAGFSDRNIVDEVWGDDPVFAEKAREERVARNIERYNNGYNFQTGEWERVTPVVISPPTPALVNTSALPGADAMVSSQLAEINNSVVRLISTTEQGVVASNQTERAINDAVRRGGGTLAVKVVP